MDPNADDIIELHELLGAFEWAESYPTHKFVEQEVYIVLVGIGC